MSEKEIAIHNIALLYSIHKELHPDDTEMTLEMIAANYAELFQKSRRFFCNLTNSEWFQLSDPFAILFYRRF